MMGVSDRLETIEPGSLADLIAVEGNPLDEISHLPTALAWCNW